MPVAAELQPFGILADLFLEAMRGRWPGVLERGRKVAGERMSGRVVKHPDRSGPPAIPTPHPVRKHPGRSPNA